MSNKSILSKHELKVMFKYFRNCIKKRELVPTLIVRTNTSQQNSFSLPNLPHIPVEKRFYFMSLGADIRQEGKTIQEAIFICEVSYVKSKSFPDSLDVCPSEHLEQQNALVLVARNFDNSRSTYWIQPFTRNDSEVVWLPVIRNISRHRVTGLLEWLFAGQKIEDLSSQD